MRSEGAEVLSFEHVTKQFGGLTAVDNVTFSIREGEIFGLIGPNGAGKTTLFNLINGVYALSAGTISFYGRTIGKGPSEGKKALQLKPFRIADMGITRTFQNIRLFKNLSVYDNVLIACHRSANYGLLEPLLRLRRTRFATQEKALKKKAEGLLELMGLAYCRDVISANLPYGLQRKLEIARALALDPRLLLLDEPAAGMNPEETERLMQMIRSIRDRFSLTVLIIEHHMDLIMGVCDRIFVLNFGKPLAEGTPDEVQNNPAVIEAYLGVQDSGRRAVKEGEG